MPSGAGLPEIRLAEGFPGDDTGPVVDLLDGVRTLVLAVRPAGDADASDQAPAPLEWHGPGAAAAARYGLDLLQAAHRSRLRGGAGEAIVLTLPPGLAGTTDPTWAGLPERVVLLGVGTGDEKDLRRAGAALSRAVEGEEQVVLALSSADEPSSEALRALIEGFLLAAYRPPRRGITPAPPGPAEELVVLVPAVTAERRHAVDGARRSASAAWTARRLAAVPSNVKNPAWFAAEAERLATGRGGVSVVAHDESWLAEQGFGGVLAVGSGSAQPPRLVVARYDPDPAGDGGPTPRHVVLVGKGVTFDTGGLSIKPALAMVPMKTDMSGAAAALAAVLGAADARLPVRVSAVLPLAENAVGASAYRPGDVVATHGGTTVEVLNTDAEGRLLLADALSWSCATLQPDAVVDVATLTGAAALGLGRRHAALYTTDEDLARALSAAAAASGEQVWRMPLVADYEAALRSNVADVANVATDEHVKGGSITAALFLRRFVGGVAWAHLDIAGPARSAKAEHEVPEGPTGFGARLLLRWLEGLAA